jgi:hypothetical protein
MEEKQPLPSTPKASDSVITIQSTPSPKRRKRDKVPRKAQNSNSEGDTVSCTNEKVTGIPVKPATIIIATDSDEDNEQTQPRPHKITKLNLNYISKGITMNKDE